MCLLVSTVLVGPHPSPLQWYSTPSASHVSTPAAFDDLTFLSPRHVAVSQVEGRGHGGFCEGHPHGGKGAVRVSQIPCRKPPGTFTSIPAQTNSPQTGSLKVGVEMLSALLSLPIFYCTASKSRQHAVGFSIYVCVTRVLTPSQPTRRGTCCMACTELWVRPKSSFSSCMHYSRLSIRQVRDPGRSRSASFCSELAVPLM